MSYKRPFLRLVVSGSLYANETFSFGVSLIQRPGGSGDAPGNIPAAMRTAIEGMFQANQQVSTMARATSVKLNLIGTDGKYVHDYTVEDELVPHVVGSSALQPPPQTALAISLRSGFSRGLAHAGRFYLPVPTRPLGTDGRISVADVEYYGNTAVGFVNALNVMFAGEWQVGIVSDVRAGAENAVISVHVGRVVDTIRSRRASLDEDWRQATQNVLVPNSP